MTETLGRGAWNAKGVGGTLSGNGKNPGPYYVLNAETSKYPAVGLRPFLLKYTDRPVELNELAVWHGVLGIQALLINGNYGVYPPIHGVFDTGTEWAVKAAQDKLGLKSDGIVGQTTMKALLLPVVKSTAAKTVGQDWRGIYGVLQNEGAWDPGAVGYYDSNDLGLAQINILAHPEITISNAFCPSFAVQFIANKLAQGLSVFHDERDAIASYNLGITGTKEWIKQGRPAEWTPSWADKPRNTQKYIDNILKASDGVK